MEGENNNKEEARFTEGDMSIDIMMRVDWLTPDDFKCQDNPDLKLIEPVVGAVKLYDTSVKIEEELTEFKPPIKLKVRYTPQHYRGLEEGEKLILIYCAGKGGMWQRFPAQEVIPDDPNHPENGGWGVAIVRKWEDPAVGWGH